MLQQVINVIYPTRCMACGDDQAQSRGLCPPCWTKLHIISGQVCDACGVPIADGNLEKAFCDKCLTDCPSWNKGRATVMYQGVGRKLALMLKHSDRLDLADEMAKWMYESSIEILEPDMLIAPVPLHRWRLFHRRYNQAALLAQGIAKLAGKKAELGLLCRHKSTRLQKGMSRADRFENLRQAVSVPARQIPKLAGKNILLVDDVMTTTATALACTDALMQAGAKKVNVIVFARVARLE